MAQKRQIQVGPELIFHMIEGQAGTFGKALAEFVMNSVDAGASQVEIDLTSKGFRVTDDGKGVQRIEDVEECLGTLGFDHGDNSDRRYGKFGLGRSQAWAFCPTTMRTGTYEMTVDIRQWGLEYDLHDDLPNEPGFLVHGTFYEPMLPSDVDRTERELSDLVGYVPIPVILNGKSISTPPQNEKWDVETDQCYIRFQARGDLSVYNLGVLVRHYNAHAFGTGGVVVSKVPFSVNVARNDILESKCAVWKEVRSFIREQAGQRTRRQPSLNESEREFLLNQLKNGDMPLDDEAEKLRIIQDVTGKRHPLRKLFSAKLVTFCNEKERRMATRVHEKGLAFVLHPSMAHMLAVKDAEGMAEALKAVTAKQLRGQRGHYHGFTGVVKPFTDFKDAFEEGHDVLDTKRDLTKVEQCAVKAMEKVNDLICGSFYRATGERPTPRRIILGVSETAEAWTDGTDFIAIERRNAKLLREGFSGAMRLMAILCHEYCHNAPDLTGHGHPPEFFEAFHEVMIHPQGASTMTHLLLKEYVKALKKAGLQPTQQMMGSIDQEHTALHTAEPVVA